MYARPKPKHDSPSIYVRADLRIRLGNDSLTAENKEISLYGVTGLRWPDVNAAQVLGRRAELAVHIHSKLAPCDFLTTAIASCEQTRGATFLALKFELGPQERLALARAIEADGFTPSLYKRQHPRIPALASIPSMPLRAIAFTDPSELIVFDVSNLSPNGILLHTESPRAAAILPGSTLFIQIEARGPQTRDFRCEGAVCRITVSRRPNGNMERYFGIRFTHFPESDKDKFRELLQIVLTSIQENLSKAASGKGSE